MGFFSELDIALQEGSELSPVEQEFVRTSSLYTKNNDHIVKKKINKEEKAYTFESEDDRPF